MPSSLCRGWLPPVATRIGWDVQPFVILNKRTVLYRTAGAELILQEWSVVKSLLNKQVSVGHHVGDETFENKGISDHGHRFGAVDQFLG